jgi:hypothetical protein
VEDLNLYLGFISASAIFSLLLPPPVDPYSTQLLDPFTGYTRAASCVGGTGVVALMHVIQAFVPLQFVIPEVEVELAVDLQPFVAAAEWLANIMFRVQPFLILGGVLGHPVTTLTWSFETINAYTFGISGAAGIGEATKESLKGVMACAVVGFVLWLGNHFAPWLGVALSIAGVTAWIQLKDVQFTKQRIVKTVLTALVGGGTAVLNWVISDSARPYCV